MSYLGRGGRGRGGRGSSGLSNNSTGGQGRGLSGRLGGRGFGRGLNGRADILGILNQTNSDRRFDGGGQLRDDPYDGRGHAASSRGRNPRMFPLADIPDRTTTPRLGASITSAASSAPAASAAASAAATATAPAASAAAASVAAATGSLDFYLPCSLVGDSTYQGTQLPSRERSGHDDNTLCATTRNSLFALEESDGDAFARVPDLSRRSTMINILSKNDSASNARTSYTSDQVKAFRSDISKAKEIILDAFSGEMSEHKPALIKLLDQPYATRTKKC